MPVSADAIFQALTIIGLNAEAHSRRDRDVAVLIQRTAANTPSFLFGTHWGMVQVVGPEEASKQISANATPAILCFHRGRQIELPSSVCHGNAALASKWLTDEITGSNLFSCALCNTPFVKKTKEQGIIIGRVAVTECGCMIRPECAYDCIERTGSHACPVCHA